MAYDIVFCEKPRGKRGSNKILVTISDHDAVVCLCVCVCVCLGGGVYSGLIVYEERERLRFLEFFGSFRSL